MAVLSITRPDILRDNLRVALNQIVKSDLYDPGEHFPNHRRRAHDRLRTILAEAQEYGISPAELYEDVVSSEEGRADYKAERSARR